MQAMSDDELDRVFRERLQSYEATPTDQVWQKIATDLQPETRIKNNNQRIWMAAASLVLLASITLLLLPDKAPIKLQASQAVEPEPSVILQQAEKEPVKIRESKSVLFLERLASIKLEGDKHVRKYKETGQAISDHIASISQVQSEQDEPKEEVNDLITEPVVPVVVVEKLQPESHPPVLALAEPEPAAVEEQRGKIKSVGDIVNFLVRQVDPRKEKIIEFTSTDEGTSVSSINLGVLKIRTKQNEEKMN